MGGYDDEILRLRCAPLRSAQNDMGVERMNFGRRLHRGRLSTRAKTEEDAGITNGGVGEVGDHKEPVSKVPYKRLSAAKGRGRFRRNHIHKCCDIRLADMLFPP